MSPEDIFVHDDFDDDAKRIQKILTKFNALLPTLITIQKDAGELIKLKSRLDDIYLALEDASSLGSSLCTKLRDAGLAQDMTLYAELYYELRNLYQKYTVQYRRKKYLERLYSVAPIWANAIRDRVGDHGKSEILENIEEVWRVKQYSQ
ncbi:hypothetical protein, partial [Allisonella histaminiformans]